MAYNQQLAARIRERLIDVRRVKEKEMMGGLTFMVNDKMCVGIIKDDMMCRIDRDMHEALAEKALTGIHGELIRNIKRLKIGRCRLIADLSLISKNCA